MMICSHRKKHADKVYVLTSTNILHGEYNPDLSMMIAGAMLLILEQRVTVTLRLLVGLTKSQWREVRDEEFVENYH